MKRFFDPAKSDFIQLGGGLEYVKKFEVVGLRWQKFCSDEGLAWSLKIFFSEAVHMTVYGEDMALVMNAFELPAEPPA